MYERKIREVVETNKLRTRKKIEPSFYEKLIEVVNNIAPSRTARIKTKV